MILFKSAKLTFPTTHVVHTKSLKNIFETIDNATFSNLLYIYIVRSGEMLGGGGRARQREFDSQALWVECAYISAVFGLWEELSTMKVFKYQKITCKKIETVLWNKKKHVAHTTPGGQWTLSFLCPWTPTVVPKTTKLLTFKRNCL